MADDKILLDVEINESDALQALNALKEQAARLSAEQAALNTQTKEGRARFNELGEQIKAVNAEAREQSKVIQNAIKQQNAQGNSLKQMGQRLAAMKKAYRDLSAEERNSAKGQEMLQHLSDLNDELKTAEGEYGVFTRNVGNYEGALAKFFPTLTKTKAAFEGVTAGSGGLYKGLQKTGKQVVKFGLQLLATPIGWIAAAIAGLVAIFAKLQQSFKKNDDAGTAVQKLFASFKPILNAIEKALQVVVGWIGKMADGLANLIARFSGSAAAAQELITAQDNLEEAERKYTENSAKRQRDIAELRAKAADKEQYTTEQRMQMLKEAMTQEKQNLEEQKAIAEERLRLLIDNAEQEQDTSDETENKIAAARAELYKAEEAYFQGVRSLQKEYAKTEKENADEELAAAKKATEAYKQRQKAASDAALAELELHSLLNDETAAQTELFLSQDYATQAEWAQKEYDRKEQAEKDKLNIQRKYAQITQADYDAQMAVLDAKRATFMAQQTAAAAEYYQQTLDAAKTMIGLTQAEEIAALEDSFNLQKEKLNQQMTALNADYEKAEGERKKELSDLIMQTAQMQLSLEEKAQADIADMKAKHAKANADAETKLLDNQYALDIAKAYNNEEAKYQITKEYLQRKADLMRELYGAESIEYLNAQNEMVQANADNAAAIAETSQANLQNTLNKIGEYAQAATDIMGAASDLMAAKEEAQSQKYQDENDKRKQALQDRLDAGEISQDEYNKGVAEADAELEKKQKEIEIKQAKRQKAIALVEAAINMALGISKAVAQSPMTGGLPGSAIAATMGALQIAAIAAKPIPKAARGGIAGGGLLVGNSHAQGGIHIEAEGGEAIINKRSTAMYAELLSAINAAGGGTRFANGGLVGGAIVQDGGYSARHASHSAVAFPTAQDIAAACAKMQIYTAITDINNGQAHYAQIIDNAKF